MLPLSLAAIIAQVREESKQATLYIVRPKLSLLTKQHHHSRAHIVQYPASPASYKANLQSVSSIDRGDERRRPQSGRAGGGGAGAVAVDAEAGADTDPGVHLQQRDGEPAQRRDRPHPQAPRALRRRRRRQRLLLVPEPPLPLPPPPAPAPGTGAGAGTGTGTGAGVRGLLRIAACAWRPRLDVAGAVRARRRGVQLVLVLLVLAILAAVRGDDGGGGVRGRWRRPVRHLAADGVCGRRRRVRVVGVGGRGAAAAVLLLVPTCGHHGVHQRSCDGGAEGPDGPAVHVRAGRGARPLHRRPPPRRRLRRPHAEPADGRELLLGHKIELSWPAVDQARSN